MLTPHSTGIVNMEKEGSDLINRGKGDGGGGEAEKWRVMDG